MILTLLRSIHEATTSLLGNAELFWECDDINSILSLEELQKMNTSLWKMVEMTQ